MNKFTGVLLLGTALLAGCVDREGSVSYTHLFSRVRVNSFCNIDSAVLLPEVWVGRSCRPVSYTHLDVYKRQG